MKVFLRCSCGTRDARARGCPHKWASQFSTRAPSSPSRRRSRTRPTRSPTPIASAGTGSSAPPASRSTTTSRRAVSHWAPCVISSCASSRLAAMPARTAATSGRWICLCPSWAPPRSCTPLPSPTSSGGARRAAPSRPRGADSRSRSPWPRSTRKPPRCRRCSGMPVARTGCLGRRSCSRARSCPVFANGRRRNTSANTAH